MMCLPVSFFRCVSRVQGPPARKDLGAKVAEEALNHVSRRIDGLAE
jgi:hypothetical protein